MAEILDDIEWYRGDSYPLTLTVKDKATKLAIDLTGMTLLLSVNSEQNPADDTNQLFQVSGVNNSDQVTNTGKF